MEKKDWILFPAAIIGIVGVVIFFYQFLTIISKPRYAELTDEQKKESNSKQNWLIAGGVMMLIGFIASQFMPKNN